MRDEEPRPPSTSGRRLAASARRVDGRQRAQTALHRHATTPEPLPPEVALIFSLLMKQMDRRASEQAREAA